ncbi:MAG: hypothetical protein E7426_02485 [Ruminococcaceae bacterium]|jgi:hypothetical protein|nr:hypothetical protein [Oscillospiraceae bacterium]
MRKSKIVLTVLALVLVAGLSISSALAYFTAHTSAVGTVTIHAGTSTEIEEPTVSQWTKHLVISNKGPADCYIRARAYAGSELELTYDGTGWTDGGDGWYYYDAVVPGGSDAEELLVHIGNVPTAELAEDGDSFNVVVVYESAQVLYDADGNPYPADWTQAANIVEGGQN